MEIREFISNQVELAWEKKQQPLLLSYLGILIRKNYPDEKRNGKSLKEWIDSYNIETIKYVYHKNQRAKIGLIPSDQEFSWGNISKSDSKEMGHSIKLDDFLNLMKSKLNNEEINMIPTSVLLKLFS